MSSIASTLVICLLLLLLCVLILLTFMVYFIWKYTYLQPRRNEPLFDVSAKPRGSCDLSVLIPEPLPEFMYYCPYDPPDYEDAAHASPLPSYEDVVYCDNLSRSFQNLITPKRVVMSE